MSKKNKRIEPDEIIQDILQTVSGQIGNFTRKGDINKLTKEDSDILCNYLKVLKDLDKLQLETKKVIGKEVSDMSEEELRIELKSLLGDK